MIHDEHRIDESMTSVILQMLKRNMYFIISLLRCLGNCQCANCPQSGINDDDDDDDDDDDE